MNRRISILFVVLSCSLGLHAQTIQDFRLSSKTDFNSQFHSTSKSIVLSSALVGYGFLSLGNGELKELNIDIRNEITEDNPHFRTSIDNYLQFSPAMATFALKMSGMRGEHSNLQSVRLYLTSTILMAGTVYTLKHLTGELRPDGSSYTSFPSGHTATAFAAAEFMHQEFKNTSPILSYSGYLAASATGVLRMYNNKHYLSDVIAGAGIGILTTKAAYWLDHKIFKSK
jgi:hypothetical protein